MERWTKKKAHGLQKNCANTLDNNGRSSNSSGFGSFVRESFGGVLFFSKSHAATRFLKLAITIASSL